MPEPRAGTTDADAVEYDPVFLHSLRETWVVVGAWLAALAWTVPYCYLTGYRRGADGGEVPTTFGIPSWAWWGIAVPWLAADLFTVWFCFRYMADDELGPVADEHPAAEPEDRA